MIFPGSLICPCVMTLNRFDIKQFPTQDEVLHIFLKWILNFSLAPLLQMLWGFIKIYPHYTMCIVTFLQKERENSRK